MGKTIQLAAEGLAGRGAGRAGRSGKKDVATFTSGPESFLKMALWGLLLPAQMSLLGTGISAQARTLRKARRTEKCVLQGRRSSLGRGHADMTHIELLLYAKPCSTPVLTPTFRTLVRKQQRLGGHTEAVRIQTALDDLRVGQERRTVYRLILFGTVYSLSYKR